MNIERCISERCIQYKKMPSDYRENSNYTNYIQSGNSERGGEFFLNCLVSAIINLGTVV